MNSAAAATFIIIAFWFGMFLGAGESLACRLFHRKHWRIVHTAGYGGIYILECGKCRKQHMRRS